jgi:cytochrome c-type biogenesis protein CcmH/NrfG
MIKTISRPFKNLAALIAQSSNALSYIIVGIIVVLGPLFFLPVRALSVTTSKGFFIVIMAVVGLLVAGITILKRGSMTLSYHPLFILLGGISLVYLLGGLLGPSFGMAFFGYGFETTTWLFVTIFGLLTLLAYKTIKSYERIGIIYGGLFIAFAITATLQLIRFIAGPATANLLVLGSATSTIVGAWSDLALFAAVVLIVSVITLQLGGLVRFAKWVVALIGIIAAVFLLFMNISIVWIVVGFISLLLVLYLFAFAYWDSSSKSYKKEKRVPWYVMILFVVSLLGIFFGGLLNSLADRHQNISWSDLRPSFATTLHVAQKSLVHNFATGYGPNSFTLGWSLAKPPAVSGSNVSDADFSLGYSYVVSQIAMTGLLGAILWVLLFVIIGYVLLKRLSEGFVSGLDRYFVISLAAIILFIGVMMWVSNPGTYALILFAICTGAFVGVFLPKKERTLSFIKDPRASFFGILGITLLIIATLLAAYVITRKLISFVHDSRGIVFTSKNDETNAVNEISLAAAYASHDVYHSQLAQLALGDSGKIIATLTDANKDTASKQAEQVLGVALGHAKAATTQNPLNYKNWALLGNVYTAAVSLGVADAVDLAKAAYTEAQKRNPSDASMYLNFAHLSLANKDTVGALSSIQDSINLYPTRDAYLLRAQIQIGQQKWSDVVVSLKQAISLDPSNAPLYVYLGVAYEKSGDIDNANKIYDLIRKQFKDGDDAINQIKASFNQTQSVSPAATDPSTAATPATVIPVKPTPKAPVAPKVKK